MSAIYGTIALDASAQERYDFIKADPNLMHTGARWALHEKLYPGMGAAGCISESSDRATLTECLLALFEFEAKAPGDPATAYMAWLVAELEAVVPAIGAHFPDWMDEPIPARKIGSYADSAVMVHGFDRYENGAVCAKYTLGSQSYTSPISRIEFGRL